MNVFTEKLDYLLNYNKMRRADLSRATGISESSIRNWYIGKIPSVEVVLKIAKYFEVSVEWLFSDSGIEEIESINKDNPLNKNQLLNFQEQKLIESFRTLNEQNRNAVITMTQALEKNQN